MTRASSLVVAAVIAAAAAAAHAEPAAIMVLPADSTPIDAATTEAVVRGARTVSPDVTTGSASVADAALMAGCDPAEPACLDTVAAQLGVQQLVIVGARKHGGQTVVDVAATRRGAAPARRSFAIGADPRPSLAEVEGAIPALIGRPAATPAGPSPLAGATAPTTPSRRSRAPLGVAIGGGVLAGAGVVLWALAASTQRKIDDAPTATPADLDHLASLESSGRTYAAAGNGLVIAGTVTAAAGLIWLYVGRRQERARSLRFTPAAGPTAAGVTLEASW